jgi:pimeloyl-ACP methyl ester carboxylesterase
MQTRCFERSEGSLAYSDYGGGGEPVLMLPGMGALRSEYRYLAPRLSKAGYRAVTADLRGHGDSSVPWKTYDVPSVGSDVLALIEHLQAGPAHIIGTSFAPGAAVWAAAERPAAIRSLVLIGPFVRQAQSNPFMTATGWLLMNNPWRVRLWGMFYHSLYPTRRPPDFHEYLMQLLQNLAQPGRFEAARALAYSSRRPSEERLGRVQAPTLVVMGTKDPGFPDPVAEAHHIARQMSGAVALISGAGHYPQAEMPHQTAQIVGDFLKQSTARRSQWSLASRRRFSLARYGVV